MSSNNIYSFSEFDLCNRHLSIALGLDFITILPPNGPRSTYPAMYTIEYQHELIIEARHLASVKCKNNKEFKPKTREEDAVVLFKKISRAISYLMNRVKEGQCMDEIRALRKSKNLLLKHYPIVAN